MPTDLTRAEAFRILGLRPGADVRAVKRAYRRLARRSHPDAGGDPDSFHQVRSAYERLLPPRDGTPQPPRGRGSRTRGADWADPPTRRFSDEVVDTATVDWDRAVPDRAAFRADTGHLSVLLASPAAGPVHPVTGRSRGPRSVLNPLVPFLDPDLTASWRIGVATERGITGHDIEIRLRAWSRGARRRIDAGETPAGWVVERGSSSTTMVRILHPSPDRRVSAVRATRTLAALLEDIGWPLETWFIIPGRG